MQSNTTAVKTKLSENNIEQEAEVKPKYNGWIYITKDVPEGLQILRKCKVIINNLKKYGTSLLVTDCIVTDYKLLEQYKKTIFKWQLSPIHRKI